MALCSSDTFLPRPGAQMTQVLRCASSLSPTCSRDPKDRAAPQARASVPQAPGLRAPQHPQWTHGRATGAPHSTKSQSGSTPYPGPQHLPYENGSGGLGVGALGSHCQGRPPGTVCSFCCPWGIWRVEVGLLGVPGQPYWPYLSAGTRHTTVCLLALPQSFPEQTVSELGARGGRKDSLCVRSPGPGSPPETWVLVCASPVLAKAALGVQAESVEEPGDLVTPQLHVPSRQPQHTP